MSHRKQAWRSVPSPPRPMETSQPGGGGPSSPFSAAGAFSPSGPGPGACKASGLPLRLVATAGVTRCSPRDLTLTHELVVRGSTLASPPYLSAWFRHPDGDPDRWWRLAVRPEPEHGGEWTLALQLASTAELDSVLRRRPRLLAAPDGFETAQTNYILKTVDAKLILNRGMLAPSLGMERFQTHRAAALLNNNFAILGLLETLQPVSACVLPAGLLGEARGAAGDDRALCVQVSFTVEYHESDATS
ncbi:Arf-GAP with SH3 domain, ANK repeat and PH domain-containing protein 2 [Frankliniella fusca]|uniref:Arf-GAP with SH3 domain, ANK repeat and PH domain-containing protein 2 n=1 Tax=Frankliniella fusca TaxID=407009 RepID=A0AAE1GRB1_9NEOP|nr:Arf-GAP with SH3 domain, ANK repeat and PH domain-containing protein 2 [Frankliniella fusca]